MLGLGLFLPHILLLQFVNLTLCCSHFCSKTHLSLLPSTLFWELWLPWESARLLLGFPSLQRNGNYLDTVSWSMSTAYLICPSSGLTLFYLLSDKQYFANCYFIYFVWRSRRVNLALVTAFWPSKVSWVDYTHTHAHTHLAPQIPSLLGLRIMEVHLKQNKDLILCEI